MGNSGISEFDEGTGLRDGHFDGFDLFQFEEIDLGREGGETFSPTVNISVFLDRKCLFGIADDGDDGNALELFDETGSRARDLVAVAELAVIVQNSLEIESMTI